MKPLGDHREQTERPIAAELRIIYAVVATLLLCVYAYTMQTYQRDWGRVARIIRVLRTDGQEQHVFGLWSTPPFDAANFSAIGETQWLVEALNVQTYSYTTIGKTVTVNFLITDTSLVGKPSAALKIAVPGGAKIARRAFAVCMIKDVGASWDAGTIEARNGGNLLFIWRGFNGVPGDWTPSTHGTSVAGSITFEIE